MSDRVRLLFCCVCLVFACHGTALGQTPQTLRSDLKSIGEVLESIKGQAGAMLGYIYRYSFVRLLRATKRYHTTKDKQTQVNAALEAELHAHVVAKMGQLKSKAIPFKMDAFKASQKRLLTPILSHAKKLRKSFAKWRSTLSAKQRAAVLGPSPYSPLLVFSWRRKKHCPPHEFRKLVKGVGIRQLARDIIPSMILAGQEYEMHRKTILKRAIGILRQRGAQRDVLMYLIATQRVLLQQTSSYVKLRNKQRQDAISKIKKAGVPSAKILPRLYRWSHLAPRCMAGLSIALFHRVKVALVRVRGVYLLEQLRLLRKKNPKATLSDVPLKAGDVVKKTRKDAWYREFRVEGKKVLALRSAGVDMKFHTKDDILIK